MVCATLKVAEFARIPRRRTFPRNSCEFRYGSNIIGPVLCSARPPSSEPPSRGGRQSTPPCRLGSGFGLPRGKQTAPGNTLLWRQPCQRRWAKRLVPARVQFVLVASSRQQVVFLPSPAGP